MRTEPSFDDLIAPIPFEEFVAKYWENAFFHNATRGSLFEPLFSLQDVDRWLTSTRTGESDSVLLIPAEAAVGATRRFRPRDISIDEVYGAFAQGHSVVLNKIEDSWPPILHFVKELGRRFCADVGVNAYLTPQGSRAFPTHIDDHDVFVLQIYGEKVWHLYELTMLPIERLTYKRDLAYTPAWGESRLKTPEIAELRLRPGDLLYVPRGMPHHAIAQDSTSLHLTFSVVPVYWTDFLKAAVEQASVHAPALRRALPPGFVNGLEPYELMRREFEAVLQAFQENVSFEDSFGVVQTHRVRQQGFGADGHFAHLDRLSELSPGSWLQKREDLLCTVDTSAYGFSNIRFGTGQVRGPARLRRAFEFIRDTPRFRAAEIPGLNEESQLVLARRLIREGLLRISEHPAAA
jgi:Cupin superfamily protein